MTEFVVDDYRNMNVVPHELRDTAVLVEPLTIAEKALREIWSVQERLPWRVLIRRNAASAIATLRWYWARARLVYLARWHWLSKDSTHTSIRANQREIANPA